MFLIWARWWGWGPHNRKVTCGKSKRLELWACASPAVEGRVCAVYEQNDLDGNGALYLGIPTNMEQSGQAQGFVWDSNSRPELQLLVCYCWVVSVAYVVFMFKLLALEDSPDYICHPIEPKERIRVAAVPAHSPQGAQLAYRLGTVETPPGQFVGCQRDAAWWMRFWLLIQLIVVPIAH